MIFDTPGWYIDTEDYWHGLADYDHVCTCSVVPPPCAHCVACTVCNCPICEDVHHTAKGDVCLRCFTCGAVHLGTPSDEDCYTRNRVSSKLSQQDLADIFNEIYDVGSNNLGDALQAVAERVAADCANLVYKATAASGKLMRPDVIGDDYELMIAEW